MKSSLSTAVLISMFGWVSIASAYGGVVVTTTPTPTPTATPTSIVTTTGSTTTSSSGGSSGGSGGGGSVSSALCTPTIVDFIPGRNSTIKTIPSEISFVTSANTNTSSIVLSINGVNAPVTMASLSSGYKITASGVASLMKQGLNSISIEVNGSLMSSCKVVSTYTINVDPSYTGLDTLSVSPTVSPIPLEGYSTCKREEVQNDGYHDPNKTYVDTVDHWANEYILDLTRRCIVHGRELGEKSMFEPESAWNRAEAAKVAVKAFGRYNTSVSKKPFSDVPVNAWFAAYVESAKDQGFITGYADGTFKPANGILRAEGLAIIARASGVDVSKYSPETPFDDVPSSAWYARYVAWALDKGIISATNTKLNPGAIITRAEYAKYVSVALR